MVELFVNSGDSDQMLPSAVSDLGLCCLHIILLGPPENNGLMKKGLLIDMSFKIGSTLWAYFFWATKTNILEDHF